MFYLNFGFSCACKTIKLSYFEFFQSICLTFTVVGKMMSMIERLGSFSITAAEMKYLISLLQIQNLSNKVSLVSVMNRCVQM